jgi:hypothetical protein
MVKMFTTAAALVTLFALVSGNDFVQGSIL